MKSIEERAFISDLKQTETISNTYVLQYNMEAGMRILFQLSHNSGTMHFVSIHSTKKVSSRLTPFDITRKIFNQNSLFKNSLFRNNVTHAEFYYAHFERSFTVHNHHCTVKSRNL